MKFIPSVIPIDLIHKSHNAPVPYPTMHYFVSDMCTCFTFLLQNDAMHDICLMHCGIWAMGHSILKQTVLISIFISNLKAVPADD